MISRWWNKMGFYGKAFTVMGIIIAVIVGTMFAIAARIRQQSLLTLSPGGIYYPKMGGSVRNASTRSVIVDTYWFGGVTQVNGLCPPVTISDQKEPLVITNGVVHIGGGDDIHLNGGLFAACYLGRFVNNWSAVTEDQLYDATTLGVAQAARLSGRSYSEFVALMGGTTMLPEGSYNLEFKPDFLVLHIQK